VKASEPLYRDVGIENPIIAEMLEGQATGDATARDRQVGRQASDADGQQHPQGRRRSNSRQTKRGTKLGSSRQTKRGTKLGSSRQKKRGTKLGSSKGPKPVADASGSGPVTRSSKRKRASAEQAAGNPKRKSSSPRSPKRGDAAASPSAGGGLAEAVRDMDEAAAILRDVRQ
jgi:hypothetical protein